MWNTCIRVCQCFWLHGAVLHFRCRCFKHTLHNPWHWPSATLQALCKLHIHGRKVQAWNGWDKSHVGELGTPHPMGGEIWLMLCPMLYAWPSQHAAGLLDMQADWSNDPRWVMVDAHWWWGPMMMPIACWCFLGVWHCNLNMFELLHVNAILSFCCIVVFFCCQTVELAMLCLA